MPPFPPSYVDLLKYFFQGKVICLIHERKSLPSFFSSYVKVLDIYIYIFFFFYIFMYNIYNTIWGTFKHILVNIFVFWAHTYGHIYILDKHNCIWSNTFIFGPNTVVFRANKSKFLSKKLFYFSKYSHIWAITVVFRWIQ